MDWIEKLGIAGVAAFFMLIIAGIYGWFANIVAIYHTIDLPLTGMFILRCIGIVVSPIGAVLGWV